MNTVLKLNSRNRRAGKKPKVVEVPIRLNLGSGPTKMPNFLSVDCIAFPGVDVVIDLIRCKRVCTECDVPGYSNSDVNKVRVGDYIPWPWKDNTVAEIHCSHCMEHFTAMERVHVVNEMWRVMKPGSKATVICPDWSSCRAYGDPTHQWPPVSQFWFYYLKQEWRDSQAPHTDAKHLAAGFRCNFEVTWGFSLEAGVASRNQEYQQHAATYFKEACQDVIATFVCIKP